MSLKKYGKPPSQLYNFLLKGTEITTLKYLSLKPNLLREQIRYPDIGTSGLSISVSRHRPSKNVAVKQSHDSHGHTSLSIYSTYLGLPPVRAGDRISNSNFCSGLQLSIQNLRIHVVVLCGACDTQDGI